MFEKNMLIGYLLDFYGEVLDEKTRRVMLAYYEEDLSLAEIADIEAISRQGVRHIIKQGEGKLAFLEEKLGLAEHSKELRESADRLIGAADALKGEPDAPASAKALAACARECAELIYKRD